MRGEARQVEAVGVEGPAEDALGNDEAMTLRAARDRFLAERGSSAAEYDERVAWFPVPYTRFHYPVFNTPGRRWGVMRHDLHHVVTGYATDWFGEFEIAAWECATGLGRRPIVWFICVQMLVLGMLISPRRTWRAFQRGKATRCNLLGEEIVYEDLMEMSVGEARAFCGLPRLEPDHAR
jgi:hypothetical protein